MGNCKLFDANDMSEKIEMELMLRYSNLSYANLKKSKFDFQKESLRFDLRDLNVNWCDIWMTNWMPREKGEWEAGMKLSDHTAF